MDNHFESKGGEQNIAQGENPIAKQVNNYGVPPETLISYAEEFGVTKSALTSFFKILEQEQVPAWELDSKLREIALRHKELLERFNTIFSDDPEVRNLKAQAKDAIDNGRFAEAEDLLAQARKQDREAIARMKAAIAEQQAALEKRQLSEAASCAEQAQLQRLQYNYVQAAEFWQEAAAVLPEGYQDELINYIGATGYDFWRIARYTEALECFEQSLSLAHAIHNHEQEAKLLNNISLIYEAQGEHDNSLNCLEQGLAISQRIGDLEGQGAVMSNIGKIYCAKGEYPVARFWLEESLSIRREIGDWEGGGNTLIGIGQIDNAQGNHVMALSCYEEALAISREINAKELEEISLSNISSVYFAQKKYDTALESSKQSLAISRQINDRRGEGTSLNNLAMIYQAQGDKERALSYYEQSLARAKDIGTKAEEAGGSWNIGWLYIQKGQLGKAEPYLSSAVELAEQLELPDLDKWSKALKAVRTKLREQQ